MSERKVKVESVVKYALVLSVPEYRFSRTFNKENQVTLIPFEVMEEGLQKLGFKKFFTDGILRVVEKQDRIDLDLESEDEIEEENITPSLDTKQLIALLKSGDKKKIAETLDKCSASTIERAIQTIINAKITDYPVIKAVEAAAKKHGDNVKITKLLDFAESLNEDNTEE